MLKKLGKEFIDIVNRPIEPGLIRKDYDKNKYISGYTVVRLLNELTNGAWSWQIDKTWTQETKDAKGTHTIYHMMGTLTLLFDDGNDGSFRSQSMVLPGKNSATAGNLPRISIKHWKHCALERPRRMPASAQSCGSAMQRTIISTATMSRSGHRRLSTNTRRSGTSSARFKRRAS